MPCVDLAANVHEALRREILLRDLRHRLRIGLRREKAHLVELVLLGHIAKRVERDHLGQLLACAHDNRRPHAELAGDRSFELGRELIRMQLGTEHDIAALHKRARVWIAEIGEQRPQIRHRDAVVRAEVDAAQESDLSAHDDVSDVTACEDRASWKLRTKTQSSCSSYM